jgi:hypothetical protein
MDRPGSSGGRWRRPGGLRPVSAGTRASSVSALSVSRGNRMVVPRLWSHPWCVGARAWQRAAGTRLQSAHAVRSVRSCVRVGAVGRSPCGWPSVTSAQPHTGQCLEKHRRVCAAVQRGAQLAHRSIGGACTVDSSVDLADEAFPVGRPQFELLQLARGRAGQLGAELDAFRAFVSGQLGLGEGNEFVLGQR